MRPRIDSAGFKPGWGWTDRQFAQYLIYFQYGNNFSHRMFSMSIQLCILYTIAWNCAHILIRAGLTAP